MRFLNKSLFAFTIVSASNLRFNDIVNDKISKDIDFVNINVSPILDAEQTNYAKSTTTFDSCDGLSPVECTKKYTVLERPRTVYPSRVYVDEHRRLNRAEAYGPFSNVYGNEKYVSYNSAPLEEVNEIININNPINIRNVARNQHVTTKIGETISDGNVDSTVLPKTYVEHFNHADRVDLNQGIKNILPRDEIVNTRTYDNYGVYTRGPILSAADRGIFPNTQINTGGIKYTEKDVSNVNVVDAGYLNKLRSRFTPDVTSYIDTYAKLSKPETYVISKGAEDSYKVVLKDAATVESQVYGPYEIMSYKPYIDGSSRMVNGYASVYDYYSRAYPAYSYPVVYTPAYSVYPTTGYYRLAQYNDARDDIVRSERVDILKNTRYPDTVVSNNNYLTPREVYSNKTNNLVYDVKVTEMKDVGNTYEKYNINTPTTVNHYEKKQQLVESQPNYEGPAVTGSYQPVKTGTAVYPGLSY